MKVDAFTKVILTCIAIFLGCIAFGYQPSIKAEAGIMGGNEMISASEYGVYHMKNGAVRYCPMNAECRPWRQ